MAEVQAKMKDATWIFYVRAKDMNPGLCVSGTRQYISHLINVLHVAEDHSFDKELVECKRIVSNAMKDFEEGSWGKAFQDSVQALDILGHLAFDERYSTVDMMSFKGIGGPRK